jgi:hypothetical protein
MGFQVCAFFFFFFCSQVSLFRLKKVLVDDANHDLLDGLDDNSFFDDLGFPSLPEPAPEGTSSFASGTSEESSEHNSSEQKASKRGKAKKRERFQLEVLPNQVCLPKDVELEVASLEDYQEYMARLSASRQLSDSQKSDLQNQRKRIRNRLYSLQKRQKEREAKSQESGVVQELRAEVARLTHENAMLRDENKRLGGSLHNYNNSSNNSRFGGNRGTLSFFAVFVSVSLLVSPLSPFWSSSRSFDTGRTLSSVVEERTSSSSSSSSSGSWFSTSSNCAGMQEHVWKHQCNQILQNDTAYVWKCLKTM